MNGRTDVQCLHRWQKVLNPELVKGPWSKEVPIDFTTVGLLGVQFLYVKTIIIKTVVFFPFGIFRRMT